LKCHISFANTGLVEVFLSGNKLEIAYLKEKHFGQIDVNMHIDMATDIYLNIISFERPRTLSNACCKIIPIHEDWER
jgi:hypothetical protein